MRIEREALKHHRGVSRANGNVGDVAAIQQHSSAIGLLYAGDDAQQRRLAGTTGPEQREKLARLGVETRTPQGLDRTELFENVVDRQLHRIRPLAPRTPDQSARQVAERNSRPIFAKLDLALRRFA